MKIIFYDVNLLNLKKYISGVVDFYISESNFEVVLLFDEYDQEGFDYYKYKDCTVLKNNAITHRSISLKLKTLNPDMFMVNAQRLSDSAFVTLAKSNGIKTGMIQHGMYIPFLRRERFFLIKKAYKTFKFFMYSQVIAKELNLSGIYVFKCFYSSFLKGEIYKIAIPFYNDVNVDFVLVYGEYWKGYHNRIFGYNFESQSIIGYHELNKIDEISSEEFQENSICYIAQTLVEDGRIDQSVFEEFVHDLAKVLKNKQVYIKLHPRSDKSLYAKYDFVLLEKDIPNCGVYIGHYSSLLALIGHLKGCLVLYEFDSHEIPEYFKSFSTIVNDHSELNKIINTSSFRGVRTNFQIDNFFARGYTESDVVMNIDKQFNPY